MEREYWHKQAADKPLFADLHWSRPVNKRHAGKLLVVGGNEHGFVAPAEGFRAAEAAGAGSVRMVLPDSLRRYVGPAFPTGELAPTTPSGSLSREALATLITEAAWADGVLLAGDLGRNSETTILLESFLAKHIGQCTVAGDAIDNFLTASGALLDRPDTALVLELAQLQKLGADAGSATAFTSSMDFLHFIDALHEFSGLHEANIILMHEKSVFVAVQGQVSTTQTEAQPAPVRLAAYAATWWLQQPAKPFEALTTAVFEALAS